MIAPQRLSLKFYFADISVDVEAFIPVFHRWIREHVVSNELLLDVADYKHILDGPALFLIGHTADYVIDMTDGKPGLQYVRKRELGTDLSKALEMTLSQALNGVKLMETDVELRGKLKLGADAATIAFVDRLNYPNNDTGAESAQAQLSDSLGAVFGVDASITRVDNDPREPLTFELHAPSAPDVDTLINRLQARKALCGQ